MKQTRIGKIIFQGSTILGHIASLAAAAMMLLVSADVFGRYLISRPIPGANEISQVQLGYIAFLSLAVALNAGYHVKVTILGEKLPRRAHSAVEVFSNTTGAIFFALLLYGGWLEFWRVWVNGELMLAVIDIPMWVVLLSLVLGAFMITLQFLFNLADSIVRLRRGG